MVNKLCEKIGKFIIHCLRLCGYEIEIKTNATDKKKEEISPFNDLNLISDWLYGERSEKNVSK